MARLRLKAKWLDYLAELLDSRTVRSAAEHVGVHRHTAFRWRHRFLHWVKHDRPQQLTGIVELPKLDPQALLVTDSNKAYRAFARDHAIAHECVNLQAAERVRARGNVAIHVQNVNAYHRRFKEWLARFHGVASCRLPNYVG